MKNQALPIALAWTVFAVAAIWLTRHGINLDTDSAMRLAQVRDLLGGQGWFDTAQHRMNTPYGLPMHWSRLVDAPLALLMLVSQDFAIRTWPLLLLGGALWCLARIAFALGGRTAMIAALCLTLLCPSIYGPFSPGDIDHHGLQLVLMLAALCGLVEHRPVLTAVAVALGLGVGLESLPYALVAIAAASLWLRDDAAKAQSFGLSLAGTALVLLLATTASAYRWTPVCDTYSLFYAALLAVGGVGVAGIARMPRHRLAAFGALAVVLLVVAASLNSGCFAGPYAGMDVRMQAIFLARINEAKPIWKYIQLSPGEIGGGYGYAVFAFAMSFFALRERALSLVLAFAGTALAVATLQYRAVPFAILFALPGLAAALARLLEKRSIVWLAVAILVCSGGVFAIAGVAIVGQDRMAQTVMRFHAQEACGEEPAMALLNAQPPGRVAAFVDQGPAIMAYTKDAAIAGPYHRDGAGILDTYEIFAGRDPHAVLQRRGIRYLMTCRAAPDWDFYREKGGLMAQLARQRLPAWLTPIARKGDIELYRVR